MPSNEWESQAENWLRWARTQGHDAYWHYRNGFFDDIVPTPGRTTLELGCGEGRVARDLSSHGHRVVSIDRSPTLLAAAKRADPGSSYLVADAAELPFPDRSFDQVVAYNSLMDIEEMSRAVREVGRVLRSGGTFAVSVTHPVNDAGGFTDSSTFVIDQDYADALEAAGLYISRLREPPPEGGDESYEPWKRLPMFLQLRAVKPGSS